MRERHLWLRGETYWLRTTVNGKQHRESLRTGDVDVARKRAEKRISEIKAAYHLGIETRSWKEAVADWAGHTVGQLGDSTMRRYAVSLAIATTYLGRYKVHEINGQVIAGYITARRKLGATAATIRRDLTAISAVLKFSEAMEWSEGNPTLSKRALLVERRDPIVLPKHDEIEQVIAASGPRFGAFIRAAWLTGCRQNELANAIWDDYDRANGTLTVIGKGNKRRVIQLSPEANMHFANQPRTLNSDYIFCNRIGEPFLNASSDFVRHRAKVGGDVKFRFHDLRHLFAVETLQSGAMGIYELSLHLGHTSVKTTEIYLDFLTPEKIKSTKNAQRRIGYL